MSNISGILQGFKLIFIVPLGETAETHTHTHLISDCLSHWVLRALGAVSTSLLTELLAEARSVPRSHFHTPLRGTSCISSPLRLFPLMKLRQRLLSCSLSAAGEMCMCVFVPVQIIKEVLVLSKVSGVKFAEDWIQWNALGKESLQDCFRPSISDNGFQIASIFKIRCGESVMCLSYRFFILALHLLSQAEDMIHTNVQCWCTHDYRLKDLLLIRLEFVCSPTVWLPDAEWTTSQRDCLRWHECCLLLVVWILSCVTLQWRVLLGNCVWGPGECTIH